MTTLAILSAAAYLLFWMYTLLHVKRGIFISNKEKEKWFVNVLHLSFFGLFLYWTDGVKKRISRG